MKLSRHIEFVFSPRFNYVDLATITLTVIWFNQGHYGLAAIIFFIGLILFGSKKEFL